jgi:hypothetical protein
MFLTIHLNPDSIIILFLSFIRVGIYYDDTYQEYSSITISFGIYKAEIFQSFTIHNRSFYAQEDEDTTTDNS